MTDSEHEREKQLPVEARADLAEQRAADARTLAADACEHRRAEQHDEEDEPASVVSSARWTSRSNSVSEGYPSA